MRKVDNRSRKPLKTHSEEANNVLKKLAIHQAIAEIDDAILRYMQLANITAQRYADYLVAE